MRLEEGMVLGPGVGDSPLGECCRLLAIENDSDIAVLIPVPGMVNGRKASGYVLGPFVMSLKVLEQGVESAAVAEVHWKNPPHWALSDIDLLGLTLNERDRDKAVSQISRRNDAWASIEGLIGKLPLRKVALGMKSISSLIAGHALEKGVDAATIYRRLHLYLASGGYINSLLPRTDMQGGRGQVRNQRKKIGRTSRLEKAKQRRGEPLSELDKTRLAAGYLLIGRRTTERDAYLLCCSRFWADVESDGKPKLWPPELRPTQKQFRYWGLRLNTIGARQKRLGIRASRMSPIPGTSQDQVHEFGHLAEVDSTSTDVYLVSMMSRTRVLPPMTRTIIKEVRTGLILGFYVGWESASRVTALNALLCSVESKQEICDRFGVEYDAARWPAIMCRVYLVDNGEMKTKMTIEGTEHFNYSVEYASAYSGVSKPNVEAQHHRDHKAVDHKLPGTTFGKRRGRGDKHPGAEALYNYEEYMHELILMIIEWNGQEVPHLAPTEMKQQGITPTRINTANWLMEHGMRADVPPKVDSLRAQLLPRRPAVMTDRGIYLIRSDTGKKIWWFRYISKDVVESDAYRAAVKTGREQRIEVRCNDEDLTRVWFATLMGLNPVPEVDAIDQEFRLGMTYFDLQDYDEREATQRVLASHDRDQQALDTAERRSRVEKAAKKERGDELEKNGLRRSKKPNPEHLRSNKRAEMSVARGGHGQEFSSESQPQLELTAAQMDGAFSDAIQRLFED
ncbi:hypothetical protein [Stenotrophomonas maltophilia]|uniref:hypothetical protein n=1 Tax=Stenotrophomonas maltophilia TaxID=40324 RepID=UPI001F198A63|nr:hypothetical protein [Stenotrophomonas maltophilia]MCF3470385.1 hypothetical protein [Stenotrophomonas maltophilia]